MICCLISHLCHDVKMIHKGMRMQPWGMDIVQGKVHDILLAEHIDLTIEVIDVGASLKISNGVGEITWKVFQQFIVELLMINFGIRLLNEVIK